VAGSERREQRARALGSILRSAVSIVVFGIAILTILGDLGFDLTPLLCGPGSKLSWTRRAWLRPARTPS
jgi:small-conductance mechanosensitive channel